ncbi:MAG: Kae1-associated serine/threonine protein kinase, partial [Candidatus Thermoplasmatota archaeon]|nr:Kae1-associated serine/threonine protein kinase [Candidatus Thermoplasmatota archaeon]
YRNVELDLKLRNKRMKNEIVMLHRMMEAGINVPAVFSINEDRVSFEMEKIPGIQASNIEKMDQKLLEEIAESVSKLHERDIIHGDLTLNNMIIHDNTLYLLDPSMGKISKTVTDKAYDIRLLKESMISIYGSEPYDRFEEIYRKMSETSNEVINVLHDIEKRRRYA